MWPSDQFHYTRQCGRQTSFIIHVSVAVRPILIYTLMKPSDQFYYTCGCRCNTNFITNLQEQEKLPKRFTPWKNYELTALYNITIQTTERNNSNNRYNEQALCVHPTTLKELCFFLTHSAILHCVSRFGLAVRDLGSNPLRLSFLFKSCGLWTLFCDS